MSGAGKGLTTAQCARHESQHRAQDASCVGIRAATQSAGCTSWRCHVCMLCGLRRSLRPDAVHCRGHASPAYWVAYQRPLSRVPKEAFWHATRISSHFRTTTKSCTCRYPPRFDRPQPPNPQIQTPNPEPHHHLRRLSVQRARRRRARSSVCCSRNSMSSLKPRSGSSSTPQIYSAKPLRPIR